MSILGVTLRINEKAICDTSSVTDYPACLLRFLAFVTLGHLIYYPTHARAHARRGVPAMRPLLLSQCHKTRNPLLLNSLGVTLTSKVKKT